MSNSDIQKIYTFLSDFKGDWKSAIDELGNGDGYIVKSEFSYFIEKKMDWKQYFADYGNGGQISDATKKNIINQFWDSIDLNKTIKHLGNSRLYNQNALDEVEIQRIDDNIENIEIAKEVVAEIFNDIRKEYESSLNDLDSQYKEQWNQSVKSGLTEAAVNYVTNTSKNSIDLKNYLLNQVKPDVIRKTTANVYAQYYINNERSGLFGGLEYNSLADETLQGMVDRFVAASANESTANSLMYAFNSIKSKAKSLVGSYLATAFEGKQNRKGETLKTDTKVLSNYGYNPTYYPDSELLNPLQKANMKVQLNKAYKTAMSNLPADQKKNYNSIRTAFDAAAAEYINNACESMLFKDYNSVLNNLSSVIDEAIKYAITKAGEIEPKQEVEEVTRTPEVVEDPVVEEPTVEEPKTTLTGKLDLSKIDALYNGTAISKLYTSTQAIMIGGSTDTTGINDARSSAVTGIQMELTKLMNSLKTAGADEATLKKAYTSCLNYYTSAINATYDSQFSNNDHGFSELKADGTNKGFSYTTSNGSVVNDEGYFYQYTKNIGDNAETFLLSTMKQKSYLNKTGNSGIGIWEENMPIFHQGINYGYYVSAQIMLKKFESFYNDALAETSPESQTQADSKATMDLSNASDYTYDGVKISDLFNKTATVTESIGNGFSEDSIEPAKNEALSGIKTTLNKLKSVMSQMDYNSYNLDLAFTAALNYYTAAIQATYDDQYGDGDNGFLYLKANGTNNGFAYTNALNDVIVEDGTFYQYTKKHDRDAIQSLYDEMQKSGFASGQSNFTGIGLWEGYNGYNSYGYYVSVSNILGKIQEFYNQAATGTYSTSSVTPSSGTTRTESSDTENPTPANETVTETSEKMSLSSANTSYNGTSISDIYNGSKNVAESIGNGYSEDSIEPAKKEALNGIKMTISKLKTLFQQMGYDSTKLNIAFEALLNYYTAAIQATYDSQVSNGDTGFSALKTNGVNNGIVYINALNETIVEDGTFYQQTRYYDRDAVSDLTNTMQKSNFAAGESNFSGIAVWEGYHGYNSYGYYISIQHLLKKIEYFYNQVN